MAPKREVRKRKSNSTEVGGSATVSDDDFEQPIQKKKVLREKKSEEKKLENLIEVEKPKHSDISESTLKQPRQSMLKYLEKNELGFANYSVFEKSVKSVVMHHVKELAVFKVLSPFDRRITSLIWHPKKTNMLAVGSKGGDIILWNYEHPNYDVFIQGSGPGSSIQAMKFDVYEDNHLYTCSIEGTVCKRDFVTNNVYTYLDTGIDSTVNWYTSLDVSFEGGLIAAGDNKGFVNMLTKDGTVVWKERLHRSKVHHIEFHKTLPWLLVTSSLDNLVKLWDVRKIKNPNSAFIELKHEKGVNAAYFSPSHGTRLLTTDQKSELRIFSGPSWDLETSIPHPHRQFQHLTPIKAHWHPLEDIVVVGRYPDPKFPGYYPQEPRCIDFFDASNGELLYQLEPNGKNGIISLNRFDSLGRVLASAMGQHIMLWRRKLPSLTGELKSEDSGQGESKGVIHPSTRRRVGKMKAI